MKKGIWRDKKGVFELPVQYMVAILVAAIAVGLISFAGYHLWKETQMSEAIKDVKKIADEAEAMYATADEGGSQTIQVNFPSCMKKAVFGSTDKHTSNQYYIIMDWGKKKTFHSHHARFTGKNNGLAEIYSGVDNVKLQLVKDNEGNKYVSISAI